MDVADRTNKGPDAPGKAALNPPIDRVLPTLKRQRAAAAGANNQPALNTEIRGAAVGIGRRRNTAQDDSDQSDETFA